MKNLADIVVLQETPYPAKNEYERTLKIIGGKLQFFVIIIIALKVSTIFMNEHTRKYEEFF